MTPEKEKTLLERHPRFLKQRSLPATKSCLGRGIECDDGWFDLLDNCLTKIDAAYVRIPDVYKTEYFVTAAQIKEKFGGLRLYLDYSYDVNLPDPPALLDILNAIKEAEQVSFETCETCGAPGSLRGKGWLRTACDSCDEKHKKRDRQWLINQP